MTEHKMIGKNLSDGRVSGVCDKVETAPANYVDLKTGKQTCNRKIRFRLRPESGPAQWTDWVLDRETIIEGQD